MDSSRFVFKEGCGTARNASSWKVCYDKALGIYTARVGFGGAGGSSVRLYQITKAIFDKVGTFEDDDYKSEKLIATGRILYGYDNSKYASGPDERVFDQNWRSLCPWVE